MTLHRNTGTGAEAPTYLELVHVGTSDHHKPTYAALRAEGLTQTAIETLMLSRDAMQIMPADEVADWIALSVQNHPVSVEDVWPLGVPAHWDVCPPCGRVRDECACPVDSCDCPQPDGAPDHQWQVTEPREVWAS